MRAFPVRLPSGVRYWTVLDDDLATVPVADAFLRQVRLGRDGSELTTRSYAGSIALFLRWCRRTGRDWQIGVEYLASGQGCSSPGCVTPTATATTPAAGSCGLDPAIDRCVGLAASTGCSPRWAAWWCTLSLAGTLAVTL